MAWEWSHTGEAYEYAEEQLGKLSKRKLVEIYSEWHHELIKRKCEAFESELFDEWDCVCVGTTYKDDELFDEGKEKGQELSRDDLIKYIWEQASENATCDNGGWNAWMCPHGCHTVPFGPKKQS
jgi:hypothetical protein